MELEQTKSSGLKWLASRVVYKGGEESCCSLLEKKKLERERENEHLNFENGSFGLDIMKPISGVHLTSQWGGSETAALP